MLRELNRGRGNIQGIETWGFPRYLTRKLEKLSEKHEGQVFMLTELNDLI